MELLLLGTAAAEAWPAPYCDCDACTEARRRGGPNLRTRSGALLDDDLKIDHGPDTVIHMQRAGRSLAKVKTILFTHEDVDHLHPGDFICTTRPFSQTRGDEPIQVYGNEHVLDRIRRAWPDPGRWRLELNLIKPLESFNTPTGDTVLPLPAAHKPDALVFRIHRDGKTLFYGHDSGLFPAETLEALGEGPPLDIALLECTSGAREIDNKGHLNVAGVLQTVGDLRGRGAIADGTRTIVTHFSHNGGLLHEELVTTFVPHGIEVAFDGMRVRV